MGIQHQLQHSERPMKLNKAFICPEKWKSHFCDPRPLHLRRTLDLGLRKPGVETSSPTISMLAVM